VLDSPALIALAVLLGLQTPAGPELSLPPGPAARAWASTTPAAPAELDAWVAARARPEAWDEGATWSAWAGELAAERGAAQPDPARRTALALSALGQGASEQAWDHFAALSGHGDALAAVLPALMPGVAPGTRLAELPDGVVLAPALPPLDRPTRERVLGYGRLETREMKLSGLRIGAAEVDVRVAVVPDGVQVDLEHVGGGAARVLVVLPEPLDFELASAYVDWEKQPRAGAEHAVVLTAEKPSITVYGPCRPIRVDWPSTLPLELDARVREHGFACALRPGDELAPRIAGFAAALERITGQPVRVAVSATGDAGPELTLHLAASPGRERKLRGLTEAAAHFALRR
jgi:hypothetical protein